MRVQLYHSLQYSQRSLHLKTHSHIHLLPRIQAGRLRLSGLTHLSDMKYDFNLKLESGLPSS
jgi:hypothetical protein